MFPYEVKFKLRTMWLFIVCKTADYAIRKIKYLNHAIITEV